MPVNATKEPASATLQQKMPVSACWDTYAHLKRSRGEITFRLVIRAQHLYPSFPKLQSNLICFAFEIYLASNTIYIYVVICLFVWNLAN